MPKVSSSTTHYKIVYEREFEWVAKCPTSNLSAICTWCKCEINISGMGKSALISHSKSKKHVAAVENRKKCVPLEVFSKAQNDARSTSSAVVNATGTQNVNEEEVRVDDPGVTHEGNLPTPSPRNVQPTGIKGFLQKEETAKAEVKWCLRTVASHLSLRSSEECVSTMKDMFPDSVISQSMQLHRTKVGYSIVFGIAPYFLTIVHELISRCDDIVIGFDESLNSISQKTQMDMYVRFWHPDKAQVTDRYLNSAFLNRTRAIDLREELVTSLKTVDGLKKVSQLSMDGPNVNHKVLRDLEAEVKESCGVELLDIGSCGLHAVHLACKVAMMSTGWDLASILYCMYDLYKDAPARRSLYAQYTGCTLFPLRFCGTRWVENKRVADRAVQILPDQRKFVITAEKEKTAPVSRNFEKVSSAVKDELLGTKLAFFGSIAGLVEPFLKEFQTDAPMAPFLYEEFRSLLETLMRRIVKSDMLTSSNLQTLELCSKNLIYAKHFDIGFAAKDELSKVKSVKELDILRLKESMLGSLVKLVEKLRERSPLKYNFARYISCLDTNVALNQTLGLKRVDKCLETLVAKKRLSGSKADQIKIQYLEAAADPGF